MLYWKMIRRLIDRTEESAIFLTRVWWYFSYDKYVNTYESRGLGTCRTRLQKLLARPGKKRIIITGTNSLGGCFLQRRTCKKQTDSDFFLNLHRGRCGGIWNLNFVKLSRLRRFVKCPSWNSRIMNKRDGVYKIIEARRIEELVFSFTFV